MRAVQADYQGHVAELLAKATQSHALDAEVTAEDRALLLDSLRFWGALDKDYRFVKGQDSSERRGFLKDPGGGLTARPEFSDPVSVSDLLRSGLWSRAFRSASGTTCRPRCSSRSAAWARWAKRSRAQLKPLIRYNAKVTEIRQDARRQRQRHLSGHHRRVRSSERAGRLVRVHDSAVDPGRDSNGGRRTDDPRDRRRALRDLGQGGIAVQAPLLGNGRANLRRGHVHGSADRPDQLPEQRLFRRRQGRAAGRIYLGHVSIQWNSHR